MEDHPAPPEMGGFRERITYTMVSIFNQTPLSEGAPNQPQDLEKNYSNEKHTPT